MRNYLADWRAQVGKELERPDKRMAPLLYRLWDYALPQSVLYKPSDKNLRYIFQPLLFVSFDSLHVYFSIHSSVLTNTRRIKKKKDEGKIWERNKNTEFREDLFSFTFLVSQDTRVPVSQSVNQPANQSK